MEDFRQLGDQLQTLLQRPTSLPETAREAAPMMQALLKADGASFTQVVGDEFVYLAGTGIVACLTGRRAVLRGSATGIVVASGRPSLYEPRTAPTRSRARASSDAIASGIIAPIVLQGLVVGTIGVASVRPNAFVQPQVRTLEFLARLISRGLERSPSRDRMRRLNQAKVQGFPTESKPMQHLDQSRALIGGSARQRRATRGGMSVDESANTMPGIRAARPESATCSLPKVPRTHTTQIPAVGRDDNDKTIAAFLTSPPAGTTPEPVRARPEPVRAQPEPPRAYIDAVDEVERAATYVHSLFGHALGFELALPSQKPLIAGTPGTLWKAVLNFLTSISQAFVGKHAEPTTVRIYMECGTDEVVVHMEARRDASGLGTRFTDEDENTNVSLIIARGTVAALGGTFQEATEPGRMQHIALHLPLPRREADRP